MKTKRIMKTMRVMKSKRVIKTKLNTQDTTSHRVMKLNTIASAVYRSQKQIQALVATSSHEAMKAQVFVAMKP